MSTVRRVVPALAALLAVLVAVQTTDLVACADEAEAVEHAGEAPADGPLGGGSPAFGDAPGTGHGHDEGSFADCLCHVVFAPTAAAPSAGAALVAGPAHFGADVDAPPEVEPSGLDHVPLG